MLEWQRFAVVFQAKPDYTLDHRQIDAISRHRKDFGGTLFFDRVSQSIGLKQASKAYPPRSNSDLKALWQKVVDCTAATYQKQALLYYILKDCRQINNADAEFAGQVYLPRRYELVMSGFWELDNCQFSRAVEHLTDPSVTPTFSDEILLALARHPKCENTLTMAYFTTMRPPLQNEQSLTAYFDLLCKTTLVEAYRYAQQQPNLKHKSLFEKLILSVLSESVEDVRAERALLLLGLPLSEEEEIWFEDLLHGSGSRCPGAKDSVIMRQIATGKDLDHLLDRQSGPRINGLNWDDIQSSIRENAVR